jgi:hypothetical protein
MSMNHFLKPLVVALLVTASASGATYTWTAGGLTDEWTLPANWGGTVPGGADTASIVNATPSPVIRSAVTVGTISVGLSGSTGGTLSIVPGAVITANSSSQNTYYRSGQTNQSGGSFTTNKNTYFATQATHTYTLTGGTWDATSSTLTMVDNSSATLPANAYIHVWGGSFRNAGGWRAQRTGTNATWAIDVKDNGLLYMPWPKATAIGYLTATTPNLKSGSTKQGLVLNWNTANTFVTITAKAGVATPTLPLDGATVQPGTGANSLNWMMPEPKYATSGMTADVYFGTYTADANGIPTDPNGDNLPTILTGTTALTCPINTVYGEKYQWRVCTTDPGNGIDPNYPKTIKSRAMYITCQNQAPVVTIATSSTATAVNNPIIGLRSGTVTFACTATVTDDSLPPSGPALTYVWSQIAGPTVTITPVAVSGINRAMTATMTSANTYTFRLSVYDGELTGTGDVTVTVYADRCAATKARTGYTALTGDLNADCYLNFTDIALMTDKWLVCNNLDTTLCYQ